MERLNNRPVIKEKNDALVTSDGSYDYQKPLEFPKVSGRSIFDKAGVAHVGIYTDPAGE